MKAIIIPVNIREIKMTFQPYQLLILLSYVACFYIIYKYKKARIPVVIFILISFFANPFRMTATPIKKIERSVSRFDKIPEKVIVETQSFDDFNRSEIDKLNKLYEDTQDEINN